MAVVNVEFRANANFSDLVAQVNAANASVQRLNMTFDSLQKKRIDGIMSGFNNALTASGQFTAQQVRLTSESEKFGKALERQKLHLREYAREWQNFHRTQGGMIRDLARQQTMLERSMVVTRGRDSQGRTLADVITPTGLDGSLGTKAMQARKELQILNKVLNDGATSLINWGKNTQWAGRQLTVGLTVPLTLLGGAAAKMAYDMDKELTRVVKVYGNSINSMMTGPQINKLREDLTGLSKTIATTYGQTAQETLGLAADLAAAGKTGEDLTASITQTTRLATLGEVDRQEAMKATLALQTAFKQNSSELADSINFLNAVENQTSTSLNDLVEAIPKAGPVVKGLGGDVKDLSLMMVAMREGGIPAAEAANAIKSGLASLINPTKQARAMLQGYNIDIDKIQKSADGKLIPMVIGFKKALDGLDDFTKSQVIEQIFGKFQFARMTALFENIGESGSQTMQVMDLMGASAEELGTIADRELKTLQQSISGQFTRALETLKVNLADIGGGFLELGTKALNVINWLIEKFNELPDVVKKGVGGIGLFTAVIGPIIMTTGVLGNLLGYLIKGIAYFKSFGNSGIRTFELLDAEMVATRNAADVMSKSFYDQTKAAAVLEAEINKLIAALARLKTEQAVTSAVGTTGARNTARAEQAKTARATLPNGLPVIEYNNTKKDASNSGAEYSHFVPTAMKGAETNGVASKMLLGGSSIITDTTAKKFQQDFRDSYVVSSIAALSDDMQGLDDARIAMLDEYANTKTDPAERARVKQMARDMGAEGRAQLLPTQETFKKLNLKYTATIQALGELDKSALKALDAQINEKVKSGATRQQAMDTVLRTAPGLQRRIGELHVKLTKQIDDIIKSGEDAVTRATKMVAATDRAESTARRSMWDASGLKNGILGFYNTMRHGRGVEAMIYANEQNALAPTGSGGRAALREEASSRPGRYGTSALAEEARTRRLELIAAKSGAQNAAAAAAQRAAARELIDAAKAQRDAARDLADGASDLSGATDPSAPNGGERRSRLRTAGKMVGAAAGIGLLTAGSSQDGMIGQAAGMAGGALTGAMLGSMIGPWGTAIGAIVGGAATGIPMVISKINEANDQMASLGQIGETALDRLNAKFKTLSEISLVQFIGNTQVAKTQYSELLAMLNQAPEGSSDRNFINLLKESDSADLVGNINDKISTMIVAGVKSDDIRAFIAASLSAAGLDDKIASVLSEVSGNTTQTPTASIREQIRAAGYTKEAIAELQALGNPLSMLKTVSGDDKRLTDLLTGTAATQNITELASTIRGLGVEMLPLQKIIENTDGKWNDFANNIDANGGDTTDMLRLIRLQAEGMKVDFDALSKDPFTIRILFEQFQRNQDVIGDFGSSIDDSFKNRAEKYRNSVGGPKSEEAFKKRKDAMKKAQQDQIDATTKHYDKLIEAEKKKEAELKKVQEAEKRRLDREKQMRDLQVSYNEAIASGNFGQAALIKNNMSANKAAWSVEDKQREQDEKAQSRLDKLEEAKEKAVEAEKRRLDAIDKMTFKSEGAKYAAAKKAADARIAQEDKVHKEIKAILAETPGDFKAAWDKILAKRAEWSKNGVDVGKILSKAIATQLPNLPKEVVQSVSKNLPDAPWDAIGQAIQGKIMGGKGGNRLFAQAIRELNKWKPTNWSAANLASANDTGNAPGWGGKEIPLANGGLAIGPGHGRSDQIDAKLSNGEFVMTNAAVNHYGAGFMHKINQRKFADGGLVESTAPGVLSRIFQGAALSAIGNLGARTAAGGSVNAGVDGGATGTAGGAGSTIKGSGIGAEIAKMALNYVGVPYSYTGGSPEDGWGCAPFVHWLYAQRGYKIPGGSLSYNQYRGISEHPDRSQLTAGDLVFFKYANGVNTQNPINHVGMALNGSTMIHAANPKRGTVVSGIDWANYVGAGRPIGADGKKNFAKGGIVMMGKAGEYVVNDSAVQHYGVGFMNALNNQTYHSGGLITENGPQRGAGVGGASYSFVINGVGCDPDEVADKVMKKIETSQRRRSSGR